MPVGGVSRYNSPVAMPYTTALITGASSGIGRALAVALTKSGVHVALAARREPQLEQVREQVTELGGRALVAVMDVSDGDGTVRTIERLDDEMGGLDLIVACAGVGPPDASAPAYCYETLRDPCHVNFCGAVATLTAVLPRMVKRRRGHLVGISSLSSFGALPASAAYCAPKAGLSMLLDCLRIDVQPHGVAVTTVNAGFVATPMVAHRKGAMPQLLTVDEAAARIARALPRRPAHIDFPQPLALGTRLAAAIPRVLRDPLMRWVARD